jgi:hypothetical protein
MKNKQRFIIEWSVYNLLGWTIGISLQFIMTRLNIEDIRYNVWKLGLISDFRKPYLIESILYYLPFGISVGVAQLFALRKKLKIHVGGWILATTLGWSIFATLFSETYDYFWKKNSSFYAIYLALITVALIGGLLIGGFQSLPLRKSLKPIAWVLPNGFGMLLLGILVLGSILLTLVLKGFALNILFSWNLYKLADILYFVFLGTTLLNALFTGVIIVAMPTANVLIKYSNMQLPDNRNTYE